MLTFAFITLIIILFSLSQVYNWLVRISFENSSDVSDGSGMFMVITVLYVIINYWVIKYIIIWGSQLIL